MLVPFLLEAFPSRTPEGQAVIRAIASAGSARTSSDGFALRLGYGNRHQMARSLVRAGLPPLEEIVAWAAVAEWVLRCEGRQTTLCRISLSAARDPAVCYRRVKRLTGKTWREVMALGSVWILATIRSTYGYNGVTVIDSAVSLDNTVAPRATVMASMLSILPVDGRIGVKAARKNIRYRTDMTRSGFTLIEILVVIVVIAVLATLVAPNVFQHVGAARDVTARSQIEMLGAALDAYRLDNGFYPSSEQGLEALDRAPGSDPQPGNWRGPYLRKAIPTDPWKHPYQYRSPGENNRPYDLVSYGADGKEQGEGENADIVSWQ